MSRRAILLTVALLTVAGAAMVLWLRRSAGPEPAPRDPAATAARLQDSSWQVRLAAANSLRTLDRPGVPERAALLADALEREVAAPADGPPFAGSYLPLSGVIRLQYLALLEEFGAPAGAAVRRAGAPASAAGREWRTLALAATGAADSGPALRALLGSSDPVVRMTAARYLGYLEHREAIAELRRALADPFTAVTVSDLPGAPATPFYPVREQAAGALRALGVTLERRGDDYTVR